MSDDGQLKINYQLIEGYESTAYVEETTTKGVYAGEDKYTEERVQVVRWSNGAWLEVR